MAGDQSASPSPLLNHSAAPPLGPPPLSHCASLHSHTSMIFLPIHMGRTSQHVRARHHVGVTTSTCGHTPTTHTRPCASRHALTGSMQPCSDT